MSTARFDASAAKNADNTGIRVTEFSETRTAERMSPEVLLATIRQAKAARGQDMGAPPTPAPAPVFKQVKPEWQETSVKMDVVLLVNGQKLDTSGGLTTQPARDASWVAAGDQGPRFERVDLAGAKRLAVTHVIGQGNEASVMGVRDHHDIVLRVPHKQFTHRDAYGMREAKEEMRKSTALLAVTGVDVGARHVAVGVGHPGTQEMVGVAYRKVDATLDQFVIGRSIDGRVVRENDVAEGARLLTREFTKLIQPGLDGQHRTHADFHPRQIGLLLERKDAVQVEMSPADGLRQTPMVSGIQLLDSGSIVGTRESKGMRGMPTFTPIGVAPDAARAVLEAAKTQGEQAKLGEAFVQASATPRAAVWQVGAYLYQAATGGNMPDKDRFRQIAEERKGQAQEAFIMDALKVRSEGWHGHEERVMKELVTAKHITPAYAEVTIKALRGEMGLKSLEHRLETVRDR